MFCDPARLLRFFCLFVDDSGEDRDDREDEEVTDISFERVGEMQGQNYLSPTNTEVTVPEVPDESNTKTLFTKTAKAIQEVLGYTPEVAEFDRLKCSLARNTKSRYLINRYETSLTNIQVMVLKAVKELQCNIKNWDTEFLRNNERIPTMKDYSLNNAILQMFHKKKLADKILESWKITVHLV
jgi:hypothetical protein